MIHPSMRCKTTWKMRKNPLHVDLFEHLPSPSSSTSSSTVEMTENKKGNARKHLSDYTRPILKRFMHPLIEVRILG